MLCAHKKSLHLLVNDSTIISNYIELRERKRTMQEYAINDLMLKLNGKIPDENLKIVREAVLIWLKDYTIVEQSTELMTRANNICKELQAFVIAKRIEGKSENTIRQYTREVSSMIYYVDKPVIEIGTGDIMAYLHSKQQTGIKDVSLENSRAYINAFYNWLLSCDYIAKNPCAHIGKIKYEKYTRQPISAIDMEKLRNACRNTRERAVIEVLYSTGCRVAELVGLKISDIDFDSKEVMLFGKGKKHRKSYLNARAIVALQKYWDERKGNSEYVFCNFRKPYNAYTTFAIEKMVSRLRKAAGVEAEITPHIIRHTMATDAIDKGMPVEQVQHILGHENIATTMIYAKVKEENVRQSHQKYIV